MMSSSGYVIRPINAYCREDVGGVRLLGNKAEGETSPKTGGAHGNNASSRREMDDSERGRVEASFQNTLARDVFFPYAISTPPRQR